MNNNSVWHVFALTVLGMTSHMLTVALLLCALVAPSIQDHHGDGGDEGDDSRGGLPDHMHSNQVYSDMSTG